MKKNVLFMLIPLALTGCAKRGTEIDLSKEANRDDFVVDMSKMLIETCKELSTNGLQIEGKMDKLNAGLDIEAVYINPEKPNSSMSISAEVSGLTDLKLKGIDQSARNLHGELNLREFTGGISIGKKGQMAGISLNDAALNSYLIQNNVYMDIDNKAFQKSFNEFAGKVDQIAESTGDVGQTFFNDEAKYAISCYAGGEFNKLYLGNFFGSKSAEEPIFGRDLYTLSFTNFREENVRKFFDEANFYDLVSYRKFRHGDFSISGKFTGETLSHFLSSENVEVSDDSVLDFELKTDPDKRLHGIAVKAKINLTSNVGSILGNYSVIDHYINTTTLDFDYKFNIYFNPQFTTINKAEFYNLNDVVEVIRERYDEMMSGEETEDNKH